MELEVYDVEMVSTPGSVRTFLVFLDLPRHI
jgi:hypothetical protein